MSKYLGVNMCGHRYNLIVCTVVELFFMLCFTKFERNCRFSCFSKIWFALLTEDGSSLLTPFVSSASVIMFLF